MLSNQEIVAAVATIRGLFLVKETGADLSNGGNFTRLVIASIALCLVIHRLHPAPACLPASAWMFLQAMEIGSAFHTASPGERDSMLKAAAWAVCIVMAGVVTAHVSGVSRLNTRDADDDLQ